MTTTICAFPMLCLISVSIVLGQIESSENCSDLGITPKDNFNQLKYMGLWYVQATHYGPYAEDYDCYFLIQLPSTGQQSLMIEYFKNINEIGRLRVESDMIFNKPGKGFYSYMPEPGAYASPFEINIISTDYSSYAIEFSCKDQGDHSECYVWVMTRSRSVSSRTQKKIDAVLRDHNIDKTKLRKVNQGILTCTLGWLLNKLNIKI